MDDECFEEPGDTEWDSGPFCRHWSNPGDCDEVCANCGHRCAEHDDSGCDKCDCPEWKEREE